MPRTTRSMALSIVSIFLFLSVAVSLVASSSDPGLDGKKKTPTRNGTVVIYWGTYEKEGSLKDACNTGNYGIVVLSFLSVFGNGSIPKLELADHCTGVNSSCVPVGDDVKFCQSKGIKVLLSLGGAEGNYTIVSDADAAAVSDYLWDNFLGGNSSSSSRPLGDAVLDGIDFDMEMDPSKRGYAELAKQIKRRSTKQRPVYLSAAPQCPFPDEFLGSALQTGLFDYAWIQFYNNPDCHYHPNKTVDNVLASWKRWTSKVPVKKLFFGLPASLSGATDSPSTKDGYMPAKVLKQQILPRIKQSDKYGGVMLWCYYYDFVKHDGRFEPYSTTIRKSV